MKTLLKRTSELRDAVIGSEIDTGTFSGYGNVKGYLDTHGTIMVDGCYLQAIPSFLLNGFCADTHGVDAFETPTIENILGYFSNALEDEIGLWVEGVFDPSQRAQEARMKIAQRLAAGKNTGLSIGFQIIDGFDIWAKDYATELPKYLKPAYLAQGMQDAQAFNSVTIVTQIGLIETSITVIPSNKPSLITQVRSRSSSKKLSDADNYRKEVTIQREKNMNDLETRAGKKLSAASHEKLSKGMEDIRDSHEKCADHIKDAVDEHRKLGKLCRDMDKKLNDMRDAKEDDDDKRDDKEDKKEDKRFNDEEIMNKIEALFEKKLNEKSKK